jgi:hypothetical protein
MNQLPWRRLSQFSVLCLALLLGLTACIGLSTTPTALPTISISQNPGNLSPTPTALTYTVGAQPSSSTLPSGNGSITIQVFFFHQGLPQPGGQASLYFHFEGGGGIGGLNNQGGRRTTGSDGIALFYIGFSGLPANMPIAVDVTVQFQGINYVAQDATSFSVVNTTPSVTPTFPNPGG